MISRRSFLATPALPLVFAACGTRAGGYRGYAFVANEDGQAVAAVDLQVLAVARHIALDASPTQVIAAQSRTAIYALTPGTGSVHEIQSDRLSFRRKATVASTAASMSLDTKESALYVLAKDPRALVRLSLDSLTPEWRVPLKSDVEDFAIAPNANVAAISGGGAVRLVNLATRTVSDPLGEGDFGAVRFLSDSKTLIAADRGERRLSLYDVASSKLITHLPVAVRPDNLCFNRPTEPGNTEGGQLFVTGEGMDGVVIVYPYHTPEVGETVLGGPAPGPMGASGDFLFIASPQAGAVTIMGIRKRQVIAVVAVGSDPGFVAVTQDDQFALVLNRKSGDMAVLRVGSIAPNRLKKAALLTVIPVGSRPVSADVRGV